jgi:hypothetical protein
MDMIRETMRELSPIQQDYIVDVIMIWIEKEYAKATKEAE